MPHTVVENVQEWLVRIRGGKEWGKQMKRVGSWVFQEEGDILIHLALRICISVNRSVTGTLRSRAGCTRLVQPDLMQASLITLRIGYPWVGFSVF